MKVLLCSSFLYISIFFSEKIFPYSHYLNSMRLPLLSYLNDAKQSSPKPVTKQKSLFSFFPKKPVAERIPCASCGTTNPVYVNYCKECGTAYRPVGSAPRVPSPSTGESCKTWLTRGNEHFTAGRFVDAISCYDRAISIDPSYAKAWNNKALACEKLGRKQDAGQCRENFNRMSPGIQ